MLWHDFAPLIAALFPTGAALYIYMRNRKYDLAKEQLKNLYNKLNMMYELEYSLLSYKIMRFRDGTIVDNDELAIELYQFFERLRAVYLENQLYGSLKLRSTFHHLLCNHKVEIHNAIMSLKETDNKDFTLWVAKFEFNHKKNAKGYSEFEQELEKIEKIVNEDIYQLLQGKPVTYFYKMSLTEKFHSFR